MVRRGGGLLAGLDADVSRVSADVLALPIVASWLAGLLACWLAADVAPNAAQRTHLGACDERGRAREAGLARLGGRGWLVGGDG